jgi:hypothetical protein
MVVMARPLRYEYPYVGVIGELVELSKRKPGWNSYDADPPTPSALLGAMELIYSLADTSSEPPPPTPSVGSVADGGVLLRWATPILHVEILYTARGQGEYTVTDRSKGKVVVEGSLGNVDALKDVINPYVLGMPGLHASRR